MIHTRIVATAQAVTVPIVLTTAVRPIDLGFIHGPVAVAHGLLYEAAALATILKPRHARLLATTAGIGCTWWTLRAVTHLTAAAWSAAAVHALLAVVLGEFYWRTLVRHGFYRQFELRVQEWVDDG